jgi:hypothetical protein
VTEACTKFSRYGDSLGVEGFRVRTAVGASYFFFSGFVQKGTETTQPVEKCAPGFLLGGGGCKASGTWR